MSVDPRLKLIRFFMTGPGPCPYLPGREERKVFTRLDGRMAEQLNELLSQHGFRRSQSIAYRPSCIGCNACVSVRVVAERFVASKSQKRVIVSNQDLERRVMPPLATDEQYQLFRRYIDHRHEQGGMADMDDEDFVRMIEDSPVNSMVVEYRHKQTNELMAFCLTDVMEDGLSMVYSVFEPTSPKRSLGRFMILDHLRFTLDHHLDHIYLGYWVNGSPKMSYKDKFQPLEYLVDGQWSRCPPVAIPTRNSDS
jgi:Putative arginyl-tRNA:protein arginylyltransferase